MRMKNYFKELRLFLKHGKIKYYFVSYAAWQNEVSKWGNILLKTRHFSKTYVQREIAASLGATQVCIIYFKRITKKEFYFDAEIEMKNIANGRFKEPGELV